MNKTRLSLYYEFSNLTANQKHATICTTLIADSITYLFGEDLNHANNVMKFQLDRSDWQDTTNDQIVFGFVTNQSDAILLRLESVVSKDYIEFEIVSQCF